MRTKVPAALVVLTIAAYFFYLAGRGLEAGFTFDDLLNLYFAWIRPVPELLRANALFYLPPSRSLGRLFYALGFQFVGIEPTLYHAVCFLFLCANIYLTYCFTLSLTGSREIAALACLLHAYHGGAAALYYNSGACYDVFCFFFYLSAFVLYVNIRQRGHSPQPSQIALLLCLYIAALNAKEMAMTLPVLIGCYELLYHLGESWRSRIPTICAMSVITATYIVGMSRGEESLVKLPAYKPS